MKNIKATLKNHTLELRNIRLIQGHDDSIPFNAEIYFNGEHIGSASNDGWGGDAEYNIFNSNSDFDSFCDEVSKTTWAIITGEDGIRKDMKYSVPFLIDCMVFQAIYKSNTTFDWSQF